MSTRCRSLRLLGVCLVLGVTALSACGRSPSFESGILKLTGPGGTTTVNVQIARTEAARQLGLMHQRSLAPDAGMVFLFDRPTQRGFWMKDTLIPLSVAFWSPDARIVAILDMVPCRRDPCPVYRAGRAYVGAVEVNRGFFGSHRIRVGDGVSVGRPGAG